MERVGDTIMKVEEVLLTVFILWLAFWHHRQKKELFSQLSWGMRIYTSLVYLISLFIIFFGGTTLLRLIKTFELNGLIETFVFLIALAIELWIIETIWTIILPKKVLEDFSNK